MKKNIKILLILIGTYIGAGFISGKEIYLYFFKYGINGIFGIIISNLFISIILYKTFLISKNYKINNYEVFLEKIIKNKIIKKFINIYFLLSFCIMISGLCGLIEQEIKINKNIIFLLFFIIIFIVKNNYNCIIKINNKLTLTIILFFIFGISFFNKNSIQDIQIINSNKYFFPAIIYANYNLISLIPIVVFNSKRIKNEKITFLIFFICMSFISGLLFYFISCIDRNNLITDFPILNYFKQNKIIIKDFYFIVLVFAIFTTALSVGYTYMQKNSFKIIFMFICGFIAIYVSFSLMIEILYPVFGICGFAQCVNILKTRDSVTKMS